MEIKIRHAEVDDYEDLHKVYSHPKAIEGTLQIPFPSKQLWRSRLSDKPKEVTVLVAEIGGEVVGSIGLHIHNNSPRRRHAAGFGMAVRDDLHRKGIGSKLLQAALDLCDNWLNIHRVELEVFTDNNEAVSFYEKHGFVKEGEFKDYAFKNGAFCNVYAMARINQKF